MWSVLALGIVLGLSIAAACVFSPVWLGPLVTDEVTGLLEPSDSADES
jgi:hypothetical protein